ncbi:unnamed protein product [Effrenium voratum]|nr:unnamed protein product [Effrenium voratum]
MLMKVKANVADFGRLAGGILQHALRDGTASVDAAGSIALGNATKAVALANAMAERQAASQRLAFEPLMVTSEDASGEDRKLLRLLVRARTPLAGEEPPDFSRGGIFVESRKEAEKQVSPTSLSRTVLGQWMRFAAPEMRQAAREAARSGGQAAAVRTVGKQTPPFLLTMGPSSTSLAVKSLAFVCKDVKKELKRLRVWLHASQDHLAGVPPLLVVPKLWQRQARGKISGELQPCAWQVKLKHDDKEKVSKMLVLYLVSAGID